VNPVNLDHGRGARLGFPEVIYGPSKPTGVLTDILHECVAAQGNALITKLQPDKGAALSAAFPGAFFDEVSGIFALHMEVPESPEPEVGIIAAGTSDLFIVNECFYTLAYLGVSAERVVDVGVAGVHRLTGRLDRLRRFRVLIAVAGFEGALPTVVGGLLPQPIIGVPTSVGYGVGANGTAALQTMLMSCANGIVVVNIDNGYGAAMAAYRLLRGPLGGPGAVASSVTSATE
jgi:NCAIR mutase (PurE)-related protein